MDKLYHFITGVAVTLGGAFVMRFVPVILGLSVPHQTLKAFMIGFGFFLAVLAALWKEQKDVAEGRFFDFGDFVATIFGGAAISATILIWY